MNRLLFVVALSAALLAPRLPADEPAAKPSQGGYAVLIGVSQFDDPAIKPRPTADADAKAMYDFVVDGKHVGLAPERVALLLSTPDAKRKSEKATKANILKAIRDAIDKTGKDDMLLIGFFGRGAPIGFDKIAFFAADSTVADRSKNAIVAEELSAEMKRVKPQRLLVLTDLAFKGFDAGKETLAEPNTFAILSAFYGTVSENKDAEDDEPQQIRDKVVALSYLPGNDPIAVGDQGLFVKTSLEALRGAADKDGYEPDGVVTVDELSKYLEKEVTEQARVLGKSTSEKEAVPVIFGTSTAHYAISKSPAFAEAAKRRAAFSALVAKGGIANDIAAEGEKYLDRMPKFKTPQELRKAYQQLADGKLTLEEFGKTREKLVAAMKLPADAAKEFTETMQIGAETIKLKYVKPIDTGTLTAGAIKGLFRRLDEPLPAEIGDKLKEPKTLTDDDQKKLFTAARLLLGKREDLDDGKDVDLGLAAMAQSLEDPYTVYVDKETMKKEESRWRSQYSGIGVHIRRDLARDGLLVVSPIKGSPAYKAGLRAGDLITEVRRELDPDGKPLPEGAPKVISLKGMKTDKAIEIILGKSGTPITVVVEREGEKEPIVYDLQRGRVSLETVLGVTRDDKDEWKFFIDEQNKIGYVYLSQFGLQTAGELLAVVNRLVKNDMKGLVLDLRYNPGGALGGALTVSDMFLESGLLLKIKPREGKEERHYDQSDPRLNFNRSKFPMVVLINGGSASASEIVAQALQDYDRAVVVGERTYGKGSVQTVDPFDRTGGVFKMTTARYFPPFGRNIDKRSTSGKPEDEWGVVPNKGFEVPLTREERQELGEFLLDKEHIRRNSSEASKKPPIKDKQLEKALEYLRKEISAKGAAPAKKAG
jgi:carboxyl-terminal processing protease